HGADAPATGTPHGADAPVTPIPHGADTGAAPAPHGGDAPVHNTEPLPPGATITDKGIVPAGHGGGPLADAGPGIHIYRDGVIRPGAHADAPPPHTPQEPALVGAGERPLVQDGVIGGGRGSHIDNAAGGAAHLPGHDPLIRDGVIGGGRGIDHTP